MAWQGRDESLLLTARSFALQANDALSYVSPPAEISAPIIEANPELFPSSTAIEALYANSRFSSCSRWLSFSFDLLGTQLPNLKNFLCAFTLILIIATWTNTSIYREDSGYNYPLLATAIVLGLGVMMANTPYNRQAFDSACVAFYGRYPINLRQLVKRDLQLRHLQTFCQSALWLSAIALTSLFFGLGQGAIVYFGTKSNEIANYTLARWIFAGLTGVGYVTSSPARAADAFNLFRKIFAFNRSWVQRGYDALFLSLAILICNAYLFALGAAAFELCNTFYRPIPLSIYEYKGMLAVYAIGLIPSGPEVGVVSESIAHLFHNASSLRTHLRNFMVKGKNFKAIAAYTLTFIGIIISGALTYQMYRNFEFSALSSGLLASISLFSPAKLWSLQNYTELSNGNPFDAMLVRSISNFDFLLKRLEFLLTQFAADPSNEDLRTEVIDAYCFFWVYCDLVRGNNVYRHAQVFDASVTVGSDETEDQDTDSSHSPAVERFPDPDSDTITFAKVLCSDTAGALTELTEKLTRAAATATIAHIRATIPGLAPAQSSGREERWVSLPIVLADVA